MYILIIVVKDVIMSLMSRLMIFFEYEFVKIIFLYGVFVDVYGVGVLIIGDFGIGKSEIVLELVKWGYRLVVDDNVEIKEIIKDEFVGKLFKFIEYLLEICGFGIINVMILFGVGLILIEK